MFFTSAVLAAIAATSSASPFLTPRQNGSSLDSFVSSEMSAALTGAVANIGGTNNSVIGAGPYPGVVIASPSTVNPDYFYIWTRDTALTMLMLTDELIFGTQSVGNNSLQTVLEYYTQSSAIVQTVTNSAGVFYPDGQGLGEAKFYSNLTRYTGTWGRPQNDGPALRATTFMEIAEVIYQRNPQAATIVKEVYWPLILNDLKYVGQYWNTTSYDLWEEVNGNSFFTTTAQHRALVQGSIWAARLNETCEACSEAPSILCFLENNFWNSSGNYILANINANQVTRSQINVDPLLAAMHAFDINATCDASSLQPCNSKIFATHKVVVDSFRNLYPINENATAPQAVAVGRYPEDTYYNGNPWYITTLAAAEVLYDAVAQMTKQGSYTIDDISLPFFQDLIPSAKTGSVSGTDLQAVANAVTTYADGFLEIIQKYTPSNGTLSEQINATTGEPTSASALTWSFAAFVTAAERREGKFPPSWGAATAYANNATSTCRWSYVNSTFTYAPATLAGAPAIPQTYNPASGCLTEVLLSVNVNDTMGGTVYISGNVSLFDYSYNNTNLVKQPLHTGNITKNAPTWYLDFWLPAGLPMEYSFALQGTGLNNYTFENVSRSLVAPACGESRLARLETGSFVPFPR